MRASVSLSRIQQTNAGAGSGKHDSTTGSKVEPTLPPGFVDPWRLGGTYPARRDMRRADEELGRSVSSAFAGSVASAKCLGPHNVADVLRLGGFGVMLEADRVGRDMLAGLLLGGSLREGAG